MCFSLYETDASLLDSYRNEIGCRLEKYLRSTIYVDERVKNELPLFDPPYSLLGDPFLVERNLILRKIERILSLPHPSKKIMLFGLSSVMVKPNLPEVADAVE